MTCLEEMGNIQSQRDTIWKVRELWLAEIQHRTQYVKITIHLVIIQCPIAKKNKKQTWQSQLQQQTSKELKN